VHKVTGPGSYHFTVPWWPGGPKLLEYWASTPFSSLANRDIFAWQHTTCLGPTKEMINPTWRTSSSLPLGQPWCFRMATCEFSWPAQGIVFCRWLEINTSSITPFTSSRLLLHASLLKRPHSHTSSTTPFTGLQLVLRASLVRRPHFHTSSNAQTPSFRLVFYVTGEASLPCFQ
jgi:hypothetical protein